MQVVDFEPRSPTWHVVHATSVGTAHLSNGLPCQDAADWRLLPSGFLAVALADGAGSAPQAEIGAHLAVVDALTSLENFLSNQSLNDLSAWIDAIQQAFWSARERLVEEAKATGIPSNDYATTLTCLVANGHGLVLGHVGDGVVVAHTVQGDLYTLTQPQRGEYANETLFLTMPDALDQAYFQMFELDLAGLAVMSDGLVRLALQLPDYIPYSRFFSPLWAFTAKAGSDSQASFHLEEFLASERVCARTDDDKSLVIAVLSDENFQNSASRPTPFDTEAES